MTTKHSNNSGSYRKDDEDRSTAPWLVRNNNNNNNRNNNKGLLLLAYLCGSVQKAPWMTGVSYIPAVMGIILVPILLVWLVPEARRAVRQWYLVRRRRTRDAALSECRRDISHLLGSIGAPLLSWNDSVVVQDDLAPVHHRNVPNNIIIIIVRDGATPHATLLLEMDNAMDRLRTVTGLSLGLGPESGAVDLAERVALRRNRRHVSCATARLRRVLCDCMLRQFQALRRVEQQRNGTGEGLEDDGELGLPQVVSLSWMVTFRRRLGEQLSHTLSVALLPAQIIMLEQLRSSGRWATEARQHLISAQELLVDTKRRTVAQTRMAALCSTFTSAHAALGACQESLDNPHATRQWLERFHTLLQEVIVLQDDLHEDIQDSAEEPEIDRGAQEQPPTNTESPDIASRDKENYEHLGASLAASQPTATKAVPNKTLVFAGTGAIPRKTESRNEPTPLQSSHNEASQHQMLEELQGRIAAIRREEVISNGAEEQLQPIEEPEPGFPRKTRKDNSDQPRTTSMFLGVSADLLREARRSITEGTTIDCGDPPCESVE